MLTKLNPFGAGEGASLMPLFDSFFKDPFFGNFNLPRSWSAAQALAPAADIVETESELQVKVDLPGHDPKSVQVKLEGDTLTIQSERKEEKQSKGESYLRTERSYGVFARSFVLPDTVDGQKCEARYEHGVLTVTLPKREEAKPRSVEIKVQT